MIRPLALATLLGCTAALIADLVLQSALSAVRIDSFGWAWLVPTLLERGRWVVAAALIWLMVPVTPLDALFPSAIAPSAALLFVSRLMLILPLAWTAATILLLAVRLTLDGGWPYEGRVFLTSDFYARLIVAYAPWALGGIILIGCARHLGSSSQ